MTKRATKPAPVLTERRAQLVIGRDLMVGPYVVACPNFTPRGWWECDVWAVTKAGYAVEYEIKLTLADFRADAKKCRREWRPHPLPKKVTYKHDAIGSVEGPSRFIYAVSPEIIDSVKAELPEWAGLTKISMHSPTTAVLVPIKNAPRLHKKRANVRDIRDAWVSMCHRYWRALADIEQWRADWEMAGRPAPPCTICHRPSDLIETCSTCGRRVCDRCISYNDLRRCVSCDRWWEDSPEEPKDGA